MSLVKAQVTFEHVSGLPKDRTVNTFHFNTPGTPSTGGEHDEIRDRIVNAYTTETAGLQITDILSGQLSGAWSVKLYDMEDTPPRVPVFEDDLPTFTPSGTALPSEVALCVSYQAVQQSGNDQRNRRGRVFLGPFGVTVNAANASDVASRPATATINTCINGIAQLAVEVSDPLEWVVYSPTEAGFAVVDNLWVDNAFDTQRRRGEAATSRTTLQL